MANDTIKPFDIFDDNNAPKDSIPYLKSAKEAFGLIPNVEGVMAQAPSLLASYMTAWDEFAKTSLTPKEQQIVYQTANFENNCEYCIPWHTILSEQVGLSSDDVEALRKGGKLKSEKHDALRIFTKDIVRTQGSIEPNSLSQFLSAGYTEQQALEVILGVAVKTMSNYTNAIAQTPLDDAASSKRWEKPSLRA